MQLFSKGRFYLGIDKEKFCLFDLHLGIFTLYWDCGKPIKHGQVEQSIKKDIDGRTD
jgi:hypothetical protein